MARKLGAIFLSSAIIAVVRRSLCVGDWRSVAAAGRSGSLPDVERLEPAQDRKAGTGSPQATTTSAAGSVRCSGDHEGHGAGEIVSQRELSGGHAAAVRQI